MHGTVDTDRESDGLTDPVCGIVVSADSAYRHAYGGALFCFCSRRCLDLFVINPARHVVLAPTRAAASGPGRRESQEVRAPREPPATLSPAASLAPMFDLTEPSTSPLTLPTLQLVAIPVWPTQARNAAAASTSGTLPIPTGLPGTSWRDVLAGLFPWRERRFARHVSREMLKLYRIVSASHPDLRGRDLYRKIVIARTRADPDSAETLLDQAEESFAAWPAQRKLIFCDVVHYVAVSEFLASHGNSPWIYANMGREVASQIPDDL